MKKYQKTVDISQAELVTSEWKGILIYGMKVVSF